MTGVMSEHFAKSPPRFADPASLALAAIPGSYATTGRLGPSPIRLYNGNTVLAADKDDRSKAEQRLLVLTLAGDLLSLGERPERRRAIAATESS